MKSLFLLDPEVVFLNHGSYGACPAEVFEAYQDWQRRLESQPVAFLSRQLNGCDAEARKILAAFLHTEAVNVAFVQNATVGVNVVARSLDLRPGDEVLATDHEYGACDNAWTLVTRKSGAKYVRAHVAFPVTSREDIVEQIWRCVTPRTRVLYLSHITSPTALRLPVEELVARARRRGILTVVDGAHAPGQVELDLREIGADFYAGNCHKWMLGPKGAGFLYARPEVQDLIEPLIVSWGYSYAPEASLGSRFVDYLQWTGTRDPSAALAVPAAVRFLADHDWATVREECHELLVSTLERINALTGLPSPYPLDDRFCVQMGIARMPGSIDLPRLQADLYEKRKVEVLLTEWHGDGYIRVSIQAYNTQRDADALVEGLSELLAHCRQHYCQSR